MFDTHMHTEFSSDSRMTIEEAVRRGKELGIGITLTEHMDLNYPDKGKFVFDPGEYFKEYMPLRNDNLLLGIEMGLREDCTEDNRKIAVDYPFDYIIGSIHVVDNIDIFLEEFYRGVDKRASYTRYYKAMLEGVRSCEFISSLGHIDYIARYARYEDNELYYEELSDILDEILKVLAEKEKAIELNTRRLSQKSTVDNLKRIYKRYYELGGRIATIGSDAHNPETIGKNFSVAVQLLEECGIRPVYFKNRRPEYI